MGLLSQPARPVGSGGSGYASARRLRNMGYGRAAEQLAMAAEQNRPRGIVRYEDRVASEAAAERQAAAINRIRMQRLMSGPGRTNDRSPRSNDQPARSDGAPRTVYTGSGGYVPRTTQPTAAQPTVAQPTATTSARPAPKPEAPKQEPPSASGIPGMAAMADAARTGEQARRQALRDAYDKVTGSAPEAKPAGGYREQLDALEGRRAEASDLYNRGRTEAAGRVMSGETTLEQEQKKVREDFIAKTPGLAGKIATSMLKNRSFLKDKPMSFVPKSDQVTQIEAPAQPQINTASPSDRAALAQRMVASAQRNRESAPPNWAPPKTDTATPSGYDKLNGLERGTPEYDAALSRLLDSPAQPSQEELLNRQSAKNLGFSSVEDMEQKTNARAFHRAVGDDTQFAIDSTTKALQQARRSTVNDSKLSPLRAQLRDLYNRQKEEESRRRGGPAPSSSGNAPLLTRR